MASDFDNRQAECDADRVREAEESQRRHDKRRAAALAQVESVWDGPGWYLFSGGRLAPGWLHVSDAYYLVLPEHHPGSCLGKVSPPKYAPMDNVLCKWGPDTVCGHNYKDNQWVYHFSGRYDIPESELSSLQEEIDRRVKKAVEDALAAMFPALKPGVVGEIVPLSGESK
jgi:hypothetical protein